DGAAGLPKRTAPARARLGRTFSDETKRAFLGFDLAHAISLRPRRNPGIRPATDSVAAIYGTTSEGTMRRSARRSRQAPAGREFWGGVVGGRLPRNHRAPARLVPR